MQPFDLPDFYVPWPARLNPNLDTARTYSKAWAKDMGILSDPEDEHNTNIWNEDTFDKHDYALFCAYIHPEAPSPELNLMTAWNIWAFYVDDYFLKTYKRPKDREGAKQYLDRVLLFMPIDINSLPEPANPMERGLADLWLRTAPAKSDAWRCRITESMRNLLEAFLWELDSMSKQRLANPIEYIEMRRQVGAALWSADLVEHAMFVEIPDRIASTRPIQVLKNTFADAVHLRNDIFSYQREVQRDGELTNGILVIEHFLQIDTQSAVNFVNNLLTSRLQQFEHTVFTELIPLFEDYHLNVVEQAHVLNYVRGLQDWQSGAHEWHIQTSRYINSSDGESAEQQKSTTAKKCTTNNPQIFDVNQFPPALYGLDRRWISAARITPGTLGLNRFKNYMHVPYQKVGPTSLPDFYMPFTTIASPHLDALRLYSKAWARQMGMLDALLEYPGTLIWDERRFDVTDLTLFNALSHPSATLAQLELTECWLVWSTYTDDYFPAIYGSNHNMAGAKIFQSRISACMPIESVSPGFIPVSPVERGLIDIWARTIKTLSLEERHLFRRIIEGLIGSWVWELSNQIQNRIPDPIDYIEMRRKTSGVDLLMVLPRAVYGQAIPAEVQRTRTIQELNKSAIDYACLTNDIISYQREVEFTGEIHNGVLAIQNFLGCDKTQAVEVVNNLMTARLKQFEYIKSVELPVLFENFDLDEAVREQLLAYVEALQRFMCASLEWHKATFRYQEIEIRRALGSFIRTPSGLGTSAIHISNGISSGDGGGILPRPESSCSSQVEKASPTMPEVTKPFANSHLGWAFIRQQEEVKKE